MRIVGLAVDGETTGLYSEEHELIELGAVLFDKNFDEIVHFQSYIKPEKYWTIADEAMAVNKLDIGFLNKQPRAHIVRSMFLDWLSTYTQETQVYLLGHFLRFDIRFLERFLGVTSMEKHFNRNDRDTKIFVNILRDKDKINVESNSLSCLLKYFGLSDEGVHSALFDARSTLTIYKKLLTLI